MNNTENMTSNRRPSRTLLVNDSTKVIDVSTFSGLVSNEKTSTNSIFLEFASIEDATNAFEKLKEDSVRVKYAYYKLFIKFTSPVKNLSYDSLKELSKNTLQTDINDINVVYFKLYKKANELIGCGEVTVDRIGDVEKLIKRSFDGGNDVTFDIYRFRINKERRYQEEMTYDDLNN
jgi:hypothetical protein